MTYNLEGILNDILIIPYASVFVYKIGWTSLSDLQITSVSQIPPELLHVCPVPIMRM
jgi:hypothetical protein